MNDRTMLKIVSTALIIISGVALYNTGSEPCSAQTDPLDLLGNKVLYPDQSIDVIPGDVRFTGNGPAAQGSHYIVPLHDCTTVTGMRRGWLEYCG